MKLAAYQRDMALLRPLGIYVKNVGRVVVTDPRIVLQIPTRPGLRVVDELPQKPRLGYPSISGSIGLDGLVVNELSDIWEVHVRVRKIQASAEAWMPTFWLGADQELEVPMPPDQRAFMGMVLLVGSRPRRRASSATDTPDAARSNYAGVAFTAGRAGGSQPARSRARGPSRRGAP